MSIKDLTGKKFNSLRAVEYIAKLGWFCLCDCGKWKFIKNSNNLTSGGTKTCGCGKSDDPSYQKHKHTRKLISYVGYVSGKLEVVKHVGTSSNNHQLLECLCKCGRTVVVESQHIVAKHTKSCDKCLKHDYTGKKYNFLLIKKTLPPNKRGGGALVECVCDCGNKHTALYSNVCSGKTKSCGCLQSYKNWQIKNWLRDNSYDFKDEFKIPECKIIFPLPFDFAVFINGEMRLIEYNGQQHYKQTKHWATLQQVQYSDDIKKTFCDHFNIPLLILNKTYPDIFSTIEWFLED